MAVITRHRTVAADVGGVKVGGGNPIVVQSMTNTDTADIESTVKQVAARPDDPKLKVDPAKPLLIFNLPDGKTFREGEEVVIDFSLANAKLKGDGGDYRVRYIVDDEEMQ